MGGAILNKTAPGSQACLPSHTKGTRTRWSSGFTGWSWPSLGIKGDDMWSWTFQLHDIPIWSSESSEYCLIFFVQIYCRTGSFTLAALITGGGAAARLLGGGVLLSCLSPLNFFRTVSQLFAFFSWWYPNIIYVYIYIYYSSLLIRSTIRKSKTTMKQVFLGEGWVNMELYPHQKRVVSVIISWTISCGGTKVNWGVAYHVDPININIYPHKKTLFIA